MLYIVQVVLWGAAERPRVFVDEATARTAYAETVKRHWEQRYAAYCEHHGLRSDSFDAAQAFLGTLDPSEKSAVHCWTLDAQEAGLASAPNPLGDDDMEAFRRFGEKITAAGEELARLQETFAGLAERLAEAHAPGAAPIVAAPLKAPPSPGADPPTEAEADPATRATPEWKTLVGTVMRLGSGSSNDFTLLPRDAWRQDVYSDRTSLEYWDWVADRVTKLRQRAQSAGYLVSEVPDAPGGYRFVDPEEVPSDTCGDSELEAWCAAGLDLEEGLRKKTG